MNYNDKNTNADDRKTEQLEYAASLEEEVRKLSARLRESESGKSVFLSNVRNEINNPLASIIGLAASISGISAEEKVKTLSALIQKQASQLDFQMRNIIIAAEIEMGQVRPCATRVNVATLIDHLMDYFKQTLVESQIIAECTVPDHLKFRTDAHLFHTIMINLVANAIEFSGSHKKIVINACLKGEQLLVTIKDNGIGIEPNLQNDLFRPFKQGDSGFCKSHKGHGLGLSIVHELVNQLNGNISIISKTGAGTNVEIILPELHTDSMTNTSSEFGNELLFTVNEEF
jgi:signal transduction histidine kinase